MLGTGGRAAGRPHNMSAKLGTVGRRGKSASSAKFGTVSPRTDKGNPWPAFIIRKVNKLLCVGNNISFPLEQYNSFMKARSTRSQGMRTALMQTLINSWATSYRYHESPLLPCILCCKGAKDNLPHYLQCEPLWACVACAARLPTAFSLCLSLSLFPMFKG